MEITIKKETLKEYDDIESLLKAAFAQVEYSDKGEAALVSRLRKSTAYLPELSFVAQLDGIVVGYIMFTELALTGTGADNVRAAALAPLAVLPQFQNKGIGSRLVAYGLSEARARGIDCVTVLGSEKYYSRFGFKPSGVFGISTDFEVPAENYMAIELTADCMNNVSCRAVYPSEFDAEQCQK